MTSEARLPASVPSAATVVLATGYGGPEVLSLVQQELSAPGPGQVLVGVRAAGVNPVDHKTYSGQMGADPEKLPLRLGSELAGVVLAVGEGATGPAGPVSVGDEVIGYRVPGAYADAVLAEGSALVPKPASLGWDEAAGLMLVGTTAVHALSATHVGAGDTVLVHAASGGVGLLLVQLAVLRGARVIGTASEARHDALRALGAEPVAYGDGLLERVRDLAPDGVDVALDLVGSQEALDVSLALVADRDRIATIANFGPAPHDAGIHVLGGGPGADPGEELRAAARTDLVRLAGEGRLQVPVDRTYPLSEVAAAHDAVSGGRAKGKIVLVP